MTATWHNWARIESARPAEVRTPTSPEQIAQIVAGATEDNRRVRMIGSGHSFTGAAVADDIMLRPQGLTRVRAVDTERQRITVEAGIGLTELCEALATHGLALPNMGDIRKQTLAGAIQTGTHGTGQVPGTFASTVVQLELVLADGSIVTVDADNDPELFRSATVGLGAFGIVTAMTLQVVPAFTLAAHEFVEPFDEVLDSLDSWADEHDHVEFYWFPYQDNCLIKHNDRTTDPAQPLGTVKGWWDDEFIANTVFGALCRFTRAAPRYTPAMNRLAGRLLGTRQFSDDSWRVFTSDRRVRFQEMEYALPRERLIPVLRTLRPLVDNHPSYTSFPIEVRMSPADDAWLSPAYGRDTGYIAVHAFERADTSWFAEVEALFVANSGRPHWGKLNTLTAADLSTRYPRWNDAMSVRQRVDPRQTFANDYLRRVLGLG